VRCAPRIYRVLRSVLGAVQGEFCKTLVFMGKRSAASGTRLP
jgi:hypothetical protein